MEWDRGRKGIGKVAGTAGVCVALLLALAMLCGGLESWRERRRAEGIMEDCRRAAAEYRARYGVYPTSADALAACGFRYDTGRYRLRYTYYGEQILPGVGLYRKGEAG